MLCTVPQRINGRFSLILIPPSAHLFSSPLRCGNVFHPPSRLVASPFIANSYCVIPGCCIPNKLEQISDSLCKYCDIEQGQSGFASIGASLSREGVKTLLCSISESHATRLSNTCLHYKAQDSLHFLLCWLERNTLKPTRTTKIQSRCWHWICLGRKWWLCNQLAWYICLLAVCMSSTESLLITIWIHRQQWDAPRYFYGAAGLIQVDSSLSLCS